MRFFPAALRPLIARLRTTRMELKFCDAPNQWNEIRRRIGSQRVGILRALRKWKERFSHMALHKGIDTTYHQ